MSAFIVEDLTINKVVSFLSNSRDGDWIRRKISKRLGYDLTTYQGKNDLGWAMFKLNIRSVNQRYVNGKAEDFRPLNYSYKIVDGYMLPAIIKALSCWLYQCCEGDCMESELYKTMNEIKGDLCYDFVVKTKEYDFACWG